MKNKLLNIILVFLLILPLSINAEVVTKTRDESNNYGVNKNIKITEDNKSNILNTPYVNAEEQVFDFGEILTDGEEQNLKQKIEEFKSRTNIDMVILTYDYPYYAESKNQEFAVDFYDYNDFGINFTNYSGVLLFRNSDEENKYYNIYTFGDAQLYFSYERLESTLDKIYPDFISDNYIVGMSDFISDMTKYYTSGIPSELDDYYIDEDGFLKQKYTFPFMWILVVSIIVTVIVALILVNKNKMVKKATKAHEYINKEALNINHKENTLVNSRTTSYVVSSSSSSGGGGGGRSSSRGSSGRGFSSGGGRRG